VEAPLGRLGAAVAAERTSSRHPQDRLPSAGQTQVEIHPVRGRRELSAFIQLPWRLYRDVVNWVPPLISERRRHLSPKHNPFFEHAEAQY
jgi:hypothetical protein